MSCRKSASCTLVPAVLHVLVTLTTASPQHHDEAPSIPQSQNENAVLPIILYLCQWKVPKQRKENDIPKSAAVFEKHDYHKAKKRKVNLIKEFDRQPVECRNIATSNISIHCFITKLIQPLIHVSQTHLS